MSTTRTGIFVAALAVAFGTGCPVGELLPDGGILLPDGGVTSACGTDTELCLTLAKNCGAVTATDKCGKSRALQCGTCTSPQSCGGAGNANVCGASCTQGCPGGYTCNLFGVCAGGTATNLTLDVKTVAVSGVVTLNGATPTSGSNCASSPSSSKASVSFVDEASGTALNAPVRCDSAQFAYALNVPPGSYNVYVTSYGPTWSSLPDGRAGVFKALSVTAAQPNLAVDVKTVPASGVVTLNAATPTSGTNCTSSPSSSKASVSFVDEASGTALNAPIRCDSAQFAYALNVPPGSYNVYVTGYGPTWSSLPDGRAGVFKALSVTAAQPSLAVDVKTVAVAGAVTLNGATPTSGTNCTSSPSSSKASVSFVDEASGTALNAPIRCDSAQFAYTLNVPPGSYNVYVTSYGPTWSSLPDGRAGVFKALSVTAAQPSLAIDVKTVAVSGVVTLNGATPTSGTNCTSSPSSSKASVSFVDDASGTALNAPIRCDSAQFAYALNVPPGSYNVYVTSYGPTWSSLPDGRAGVFKALSVTAAQPNLAVDVKTVPASGVVTLNAATPTSGTNCTSSPSSSKASVSFVDEASGTALNAPIRCDSAQFAWGLNVPPGTYTVYVTSYGPTWSSLPDGRSGVMRLAVP